MNRLFLCGAAALAFAPLQAARAETAEQLAALFGAPEQVLDISLSPDGKRMAYIAPAGRSIEALYVVDLAGDATPKAILAHRDPDSQLTDCQWATDERLVCEVYYVAEVNGVLLGATRMFALGADGSGATMLTEEEGSNALGIQQDGGTILAFDLPGAPGRILMTRERVKEYSTGTHLANTQEGLSVEEVNIANGRRRAVEGADPINVGFVADDKGRIRLKVTQALDSSGYRRPGRKYYVRATDSDGWKLLSESSGSDDDAAFVPVAVDAGRNVAFGFVGMGGYTAVSSMALDGSGQIETVLARSDVDVDSLIRIGRQRRVVGVSYATEKREVAYFDEELRQLTDQFRAALPGRPLIDIVGASADERQLLLIASSDTDPGMVYLYDKGSRQLQELLPLRPPLEGRQMGEMKPVSFTAGDGTAIPGYLTLPPGSGGKGLPAIVLPHGGPSARDEWGFDWLVQFFVARGYAVLQPNFRGSAGYGSAWFGRNGFQAWRTAIGDVNDAGRWLVSQGIADPDRLAIVGWSYGGYAALQSQVLDNALYKAVVAIAPVTDLELLREEARVYTSYRLVNRFVGTGEHVAAGSPARNAAAFAAPVLLIHGTRDQNVDVEQSRLMRGRLEERGKPVTYIEYEDRDHQIDDAEARTGMLVAIDKFLASALGAD